MDENFEKRNRYHKKSEVHNLDSKLELRMNNKKHMKKLKKKQVWKNKLSVAKKIRDPQLRFEAGTIYRTHVK